MVVALLAVRWAATATTANFAINLVATYAGIVVVSLAWAHDRRAGLLRWIIATATLVVCGGVLELPAAARWIDYRSVFRTPILAPDDNPYFDFDPELLFRRQPFGHFQGVMDAGDMSYVFDVPDAEPLAYDVTYDSHGFRNSEELSSAEVVVIGDSFVEGTYVAERDLLSGVMARRLGSPVGNFGVIAYGPQQELVVLRRYALPLKPRTVVWVFYEGNDLKDAERYEDIRANPGPAIARKNSFWGRSFSKNALQFASRLAGDPKPSALPRSAWVTDAQGQRIRIYFLYPGLALGPEFDRSIQLTTTALTTASQLAAAQGARLIVAFAPTKYRVFRDFCEFEPGVEGAHWVLNDLPDRLRLAVQTLGGNAEFVDLTLPLQDAAGAGAMPYARADAHWSALGHRIAADAILTAMSKNPEGAVRALVTQR